MKEACCNRRNWSRFTAWRIRRA